ncbi:hypothetical protein F4779DRAFT_619247 [Xylariaceae sp. FL0662B]|nr:hypothetical protein F4779DRAFT_619247 [Xylariaceae sp. FL0662B]
MNFIKSLFFLLAYGLWALGAVIEQRTDFSVSMNEIGTAGNNDGLKTDSVSSCITICAAGKTRNGWEKILAHMGASKHADLLEDFQHKVEQKHFDRGTLYISIGYPGQNYVAAQMQSDPEFAAQAAVLGGADSLQGALDHLSTVTYNAAENMVNSNGGNAEHHIGSYQRADSEGTNHRWGTHRVSANGEVKVDGSIVFERIR